MKNSKNKNKKRLFKKRNVYMFCFHIVERLAICKQWI